MYRIIVNSLQVEDARVQITLQENPPLFEISSTL